MDQPRKGEPPGRHFRSGRCFMANGAWYVATRERIDVGPYATREAAQRAATELTAMLSDVADPDAALRLIREYLALRTR